MLKTHITEINNHVLPFGTDDKLIENWKISRKYIRMVLRRMWRNKRDYLYSLLPPVVRRSKVPLIIWTRMFDMVTNVFFFIVLLCYMWLKYTNQLHCLKFFLQSFLSFLTLLLLCITNMKKNQGNQFADAMVQFSQ